MTDQKVVVIIPTLAADRTLDDCLASLGVQSIPVEVIVVANGPVERALPAFARLIRAGSNLGYGAAINLGIRESTAPFVLALNDDTVADPKMVETLLETMEARYEIGMCAPQIRLYGQNAIDSTGMVIASDGSSKQRGHGAPVMSGGVAKDALLPSGCAALYRRAMLDEVGLFAEDFFLYCEDTDLGLRGRLKAWECMFVPGAIVDHKYSHSSGGASALKAYYVERNRIYLVVRNFPMRMVLASPFWALIRYYWHWQYRKTGKGKAAEYAGAEPLWSIVFRAWRDGLKAGPRLWRERKQIQAGARLNPEQFAKLLRSYRISEREVASL